MIHTLTVHHRDSRWLRLQLPRLKRHLADHWRLYLSVDYKLGEREVDVDAIIQRHGVRTNHRVKLMRLCDRATRSAKHGDLLLFLDGDAFPIADVQPLAKRVERRKFAAVQRLELDDRKPHPSFALAEVGWWVRAGGTWDNRLFDAFWRRATRRGLEWIPLLRTDGTEHHRSFFSVYGDLVYHHGAGFREPTLMNLERDRPDYPQVLERNRRIHEVVYRNIVDGCDFWDGLDAR